MFNVTDDVDYSSKQFKEHIDHSADGAHGIHGTSTHDGSSHMMSMTFHGGYVETILFSWWNVSEFGQFVGSFFAIFLMALLYEGLKYYRKHLLWKTYTGLQYCAVAPPDKGCSEYMRTRRTSSYTANPTHARKECSNNDEYSARMANCPSWDPSSCELHVNARIYDV
ncbi:hypothetical protein ACJJTC_010064 [Scirpophaga incertulas]